MAHDLFQEFYPSKNPDTKLKRIARILEGYPKVKEDIDAFIKQTCERAQRDATHLDHDPLE